MGSPAVLGILGFVACLIAIAAFAIRAKTRRSRQFLQVKRILASDEQVQARALLDSLVEVGKQPGSGEEQAAATTVFRTLAIVGQKARVGIVSVPDLERPYAAMLTRYWEHFTPWVEEKRVANRAYYEHYEWLCTQFARRQAQRESKRNPARAAKSAPASS